MLSGNRNFEGRIHPLVKTNWLASPPLVVAYALAGNMNIDLTREPLGQGKNGEPVYLKDIWPSGEEIARAVEQVSTEMFRKEYAEVFSGTEEWKAIKVEASDTYDWQEDSTYIRLSPFFDEMGVEPLPVEDIRGARILAMLGDSVTTDHISPAGSIKADSPAGRYLQEHGVARRDFNSYGSRRGNHEVMMRGTFANIRIRNEMVPWVEGGMTRHLPDPEPMAIYDAAMLYKAEGTPLAVIAGKEYGSGSSRDWAAKGPRLLGIRVVIAESFERIHRSNLIGMGILPLEFPQGVTRKTLRLTGEERIDISDLQSLQPGATVPVTLTRADGSQEAILVGAVSTRRQNSPTTATTASCTTLFVICCETKGQHRWPFFGYSTGLFCRLAVQQMAHLGGFGVQIVSVFRVTPDDQRHPLHNVDPGFGKNFHFFGLLVNNRTCSTLSNLNMSAHKVKSRSSAAKPS